DNPMLMSHQAYGPEVGVPRLLSLLAEYAVPATFFVPGLTAELHPAVVERILEAGHEIGHHSYTHRSPLVLSEAEERRELERALGRGDVELVEARQAAERARADESLPRRKHEPLELEPGLYPG